jgi:hypothetical protein
MPLPAFVGSFLSVSLATVVLAVPQAIDETVAQSAPDGAPSGPGPGGPRGGSDLPKFDDVSKGFERVQSGDQPSLFGLWVNRKDEQALVEFPKGWEKMKFFIAATPAGGVIFSGLQGPARYVFWRQYGNRLALVEPQLDVRSNGEQSSKDSVKRIFTDRVLLEIPIAAMGPGGQPVIDLDQLLVAQGAQISGQALNPRLAKLTKTKSFPQNLEIAVEAPDQGGSYKSVHYSISAIPEQGAYKPRPADDRVGYFLTDYRDLGQYGTETNMVRYINRWDLQKRDPKLSVSPPKEPIVFYVEHTVPVRYRRFVRDGILQWNDAFRKIGIDNAIEVYQQDEVTGAHMDKDPEDVRYNFVRWLNNDVATAIGPSRAHPLTGQILDADIILTDGWIRAFYNWYDERPLDAAQSLSSESLVWLESHPEWDPRLLGLPVDQRDAELKLRQARAAAGDPDPADSRKDPLVAGRPEFLEVMRITTGGDALAGHGDPAHRCGATCFAAQGLAMDMAFANMQLEMFGMIGQETPKPGTPPAEPTGDLLDGVPEAFVGPQLEHLVAHEVGHTLGLRHNFKSSSLYTLDEINSEAVKGKKPLGGSVMDYLPTNFNVDGEAVQGDYTMIGIGPYDLWAIEYGYTFDDPAKVLARVGEPGHAYLTDEDTGGPDPLARRYDFSKDPLDYANAQMELVRKLRSRLLAGYLKDGDAWERVRKGYLKTLGKQRQMIDMMSGWVGGTHVNRVKKGDPNTGDPLVPVDAKQQRAALQFVIENAFRDDAYGLSPELLNKMSVEKWSFEFGPGSSSTWPINDQIAALQGTALTLIVNPSTLTRVMDNELRTPAGQDAITLPELMNALSGEIYKELGESNAGKGWNDRNPMVSAFRRNLQVDYTDRLIKVATGNASMPRTVRQQAQFELEKLSTRLAALEKSGKLDGYTAAHVSDMAERVKKAREAIYVAQ